MEKISLEEHKIIGKALKIINNKVLKEIISSRKKIINSSTEMKAYQLCFKLKDYMEQILFKNYLKEATTDIYYGKLEVKNESRTNS